MSDPIQADNSKKRVRFSDAVASSEDAGDLSELDTQKINKRVKTTQQLTRLPQGAYCHCVRAATPPTCRPKQSRRGIQQPVRASVTAFVTALVNAQATRMKRILQSSSRVPARLL